MITRGSTEAALYILLWYITEKHMEIIRKENKGDMIN
jgi:hypothetical protein